MEGLPRDQPPLRQAENVCLLIADISGYTGYLTSTELEHAQDVIADFIETVINSLEPAFSLIETEGDAVFVVAPLDGLNGQLVLDIVDACYFTFRRHSRSVILSTTCECNACLQIGTLDLKFVIHTGAVVRSHMGRRENVTGEPVIVAHRLLKNSVKERFGPHAYLLLTDRAMADLRLDGRALECSKSTETYPDIGEVVAHVFDLEDRWQAAESAGQLRVTRDTAHVVVEHVFPAPPAVVWDYLLDPPKRLLYESGLVAIDEDLAGGRRDIGARIHCAHGGFASDHEILEWRPFERFTKADVVAGMGTLRNTVSLQSDGEQTRVENLTLITGRPPALDQAQLAGMLEAAWREDYDRLEMLLAGHGRS